MRAIQRALRDGFVLIALAALLWALHLYGRTLPTAALAAAWAALTTVIATGMFRRARIRRRAFLAAYLRAGSPLERRLRGGWLMAARSVTLAAGLGLVLTVALLRVDGPPVWVVLVGALPLLVLTRALLGRALAAHANERYRPELVWRVSLLGVGSLMVAMLAVLAFHQPQPDLGGVSLESAVWHLVDQERARSEPAQILLQMAAAKDALRLWLAQQLMPEPGASFLQALGWLLVLAEEGLFVWSYLLLCSAVLIGVKSDDRTG